MTNDAERAARVEAWNDVRSLGLSTWKRHAALAAEHTSGGDAPGVARAVYDRHASFAGYVWRRWADRASPSSGIQDIGWIFRRRFGRRGTLDDGSHAFQVDESNAFHDPMPLAHPASGALASKLMRRSIAWNALSSARIGTGLIAPAPAGSTSLPRTRFLTLPTASSSPFGHAGAESSRAAEPDVVADVMAGLAPPRRLAGSLASVPTIALHRGVSNAAGQEGTPASGNGLERADWHASWHALHQRRESAIATPNADALSGRSDLNLVVEGGEPTDWSADEPFVSRAFAPRPTFSLERARYRDASNSLLVRLAVPRSESVPDFTGVQDFPLTLRSAATVQRMQAHGYRPMTDGSRLQSYPADEAGDEAVTRADSVQPTDMPASMSPMGGSSIEQALRRLNAAAPATNTTATGRRESATRVAVGDTASGRSITIAQRAADPEWAASGLRLGRGMPQLQRKSGAAWPRSDPPSPLLNLRPDLMRLRIEHSATAYGPIQRRPAPRLPSAFSIPESLAGESHFHVSPQDLAADSAGANLRTVISRTSGSSRHIDAMDTQRLESNARTTAPPVQWQTGTDQRESVHVGLGMSPGLSAQIDTGKLRERELDASNAAPAVAPSDANETQSVPATSSMTTSDSERSHDSAVVARAPFATTMPLTRDRAAASFADQRTREPLGLTRSTEISFVHGGAWAFPKAITPGATVAATHLFRDGFLARSSMTPSDSERSNDSAVLARAPFATSMPPTHDVAAAPFADSRAREPLGLVRSTGIPFVHSGALAFPKATTPEAAVAATHLVRDGFLARSSMTASDSERSSAPPVVARMPFETTRLLSDDIANASFADRRAREPLTLSWSARIPPTHRPWVFPKTIGPGTAGAATYLLTTAATATASSLPLIDRAATPRADRQRGFADLPLTPLATSGEALDSPAPAPMHVMHEMPTTQVSVISRAPSATALSSANDTATAPFVLPRLRQPMRLSAPESMPVTGGDARPFAKTLDRMADGKPSLVVTAVSRATDIVPSIDRTAAGLDIYRRPRVTERPLEIERQAHAMLAPSSSFSGYTPARATPPEDTFGVVPAPTGGRVAPNSESGTASGARDTGEKRPDPDEIAQQAWRAIMDRLTIERERRGFTRWP